MRNDANVFVRQRFRTIGLRDPRDRHRRKKAGVVPSLGYENVGHFVLPTSSWTEFYYDPLEKRITQAEPTRKGIRDAEELELQLAAANQDPQMKYWIWKISLTFPLTESNNLDQIITLVKPSSAVLPVAALAK